MKEAPQAHNPEDQQSLPRAEAPSLTNASTADVPRSSRWSFDAISLAGSLIAVLGLSIVVAHAIASIDGMAFAIVGALVLLLIYGCLTTIVTVFRWSSHMNEFLRFTVVTRRVLLWTLPFVLFLFYPAFSGALYRSSVDKAICSNRLLSLSCAMQAYHDFYGCPVPQCTMDEEGQRLHGWRVLLLPFLNQQELYDELRLNEPWNSEYNSAVFRKYPEAAACFRCPAENAERNDATMNTSYVMLSGNGTEYRLPDQNDSEAAILLGEVLESGIHWAEPDDRPKTAEDVAGNRSGDVVIACHHRIANVLLRDGTVRSVPSGQILVPTEGKQGR